MLSAVLLLGVSPAIANESAAPLVHEYSRTEAAYAVPKLQMMDKEGREVNLLETINYGGPVMLQFVFTTCSTICPILSASFSVVQPDLDAQFPGGYRLISVSIDPEEDRPEKLQEYAKRFKSGKNWYFLTGKQADVQSLLNAFDATFPANNKMSHKSLTFLRRGAGSNWIRLEGLLSKNNMLEEYKIMMGVIASE